MTAAAVLIAASLAFTGAFPQGGGDAGKAAALLRRVYDEVRTLGPGSSATSPPAQQDFFIGGPDDDDTNKDIHVVVLLYRVEGFEMMNIRVTELERSRVDPRVKHARGSRSCACRVDPDGITLASSEFGERDLARTAAELLQAIADKKRLIKG